MPSASVSVRDSRCRPVGITRRPGPELRAKGYTEGPILLSRGPKLGHVIVGGESGSGARPFDVAWARAIIQQCQAAQVPAFCKQLGSRPVEWRTALSRVQLNLNDAKGGDMAEWPIDLRVQELP